MRRRGRVMSVLRTRAVGAVAALAVLAAVLVPVFQMNLLAPGDTYFFTNFDTESQALVLADIEMGTTDAPASPWGLQNAQPDVQSPYATFDGLQNGVAPTAASYAPYPSSLGLQGRLFIAAYDGGCGSLGCLNTLECGLFSTALVVFLGMVALITRRSLAIVILVSCLLSPWVVSVAHNLYWVPWTWLLPAVAACAAVIARTARTRLLAVIGVGLFTALKASMGYEFLTTTTLLAASMPVIANAFSRERTWRTTAGDAARIFGAAVAGFLVVLVVHAFVSGSGDPVAGLHAILQDAMKRTYGPSALGVDGITAQSLQVSPLRVLSLYLFEWRTSLFSIGVGSPFTVLAVGPGSFWVLVMVAAAVPVVGYFRGDPFWKRDSTLILSSAAPAVSWFIIGKSHSWTAPTVNFVLWYLILVPVLVWVVAAAIGRSATVARVRTALRLINAAPVDSP